MVVLTSVSVAPFLKKRKRRSLVMKVLLWACFLAFVVSGDPQTADKKDCVFIHGSGNLQASAPTPTDTSYWGKVHTLVPQCGTTTFLHLDTVTSLLDDPVLMNSLCSQTANAGRVAPMKNASTTIIRNKIIFTHSMANLILASGIRHGICDIDETTEWYADAPPTYGSKSADWIGNLCDNPSKFDQILREFAARFHYCPSVHASLPNPSYVSLMTNYTAVQKLPHPSLAEVMGQRIKGAACGTSPFGLVSIDAAPLELLSKLVGFKDANDGMVDINTCQAIALTAYQRRLAKGEAVTWGTTPESDFYIAAVNHADLTCRNGDGQWGTDRKPCSWFSYRGLKKAEQQSKWAKQLKEEVESATQAMKHGTHKRA
eukprot:TRINITY_DN5902_c0_g1_i1.p1 TRINITY_DN5902_c0_g1~~TRINITY_DN5902_c0_g1_i1.p1  ORF type:complete len:372 (-),score=67.63 TRINITY_DN5902_c0_g1_i1:183-1298(-)